MMTNVIHSLPYPSIDAGNISFPEGRYDVDVCSLANGTSIQITHYLENAPFIENLIKRGRAQYGCLLYMPITGYRKLNLCSNSVHSIEWDISIIGEPPIIRPMIVALDSLEHEFSATDGVAKIWIGKKINIPKGARLARGHYLRQGSSLRSLLDIEENDKLPDGCFTVSSNLECGFRFTVEVASDVSEFLSSNQAPQLYQSIRAHMVSMCFVILQNEQGYDEDDNRKWEEHSNLRMLSGLLEEKGLPHWSDNKNFQPDKVAMALHPLTLPRTMEGE